LHEKLNKDFKDFDVEAVLENGDVVLKLGDSGLFGSGRARLSQGGRSFMRKIGCICHSNSAGICRCLVL